jgi:hypothetical protein
MTPNSFVVRKLSKQGRSIYEASSNDRDPLANATAIAGAVHEVRADELLLSSEEISTRLEGHQLRSTDLVKIDGTWTTIAESPPFFEIAEPYARRERRIQNLKSALILFLSIAGTALALLLRVGFRR